MITPCTKCKKPIFIDDLCVAGENNKEPVCTQCSGITDPREFSVWSTPGFARPIEKYEEKEPEFEPAKETHSDVPF
jgi:hypothetical protein